MKQHLTDAWRTVAPPRDDPHGPLPPLLVLLTIVTGLVDAFSYLELGRVFVANMTGNVVFLAFALGGAPGFVWWASLLGVATFIGGAFLGGRIASARGVHRGRHLLTAASVQGAIVLVATIVAFVLPTPFGDAALVVLIVLLGVGMGLQNATARAIAVPDLTTTVLTLTLVGISADSKPAGGAGGKVGRRFVSIASMFVGALIGSALVTAHLAPFVLVLATVLLAVIVARAARFARSTDAWTTKP
ncbi:YoaK family protein [Gryllotalpicola reticulitermitis]|uniref:YoaK family protein n=1 Tax=Gryllotalpicola reticulitermitis TaxID=1184153 RepID=A0ABV8QCZ8_9MICO